jgi:hypothetical protein
MKNDRNLRQVVTPIKDKFIQYWCDIPVVYAFAFILDPRAKMKGFSNILRLLSQLNGNDYSYYLTKVRAELSIVFAKYYEKCCKELHNQALQVRKGLLGVRSLEVMLLGLVLLVLVLLVLVLVLVVLPPCIGDHLLVLCCKLLLLVLL